MRTRYLYPWYAYVYVAGVVVLGTLRALNIL